MTEVDSDDPWVRWYAAYQATRTERRAELARLLDRKRAVNRVASFLVGYMLACGAVASLAVKLVMAN